MFQATEMNGALLSPLPFLSHTFFPDFLAKQLGGDTMFDFLQRERQVGSFWEWNGNEELKVLSMETDNWERIDDKLLGVTQGVPNQITYTGTAATITAQEWADGARILFVRPWQTYRTGCGILAAGPIGR